MNPASFSVMGDFNPLPPYGGRRLSAVFITTLSVFQSTPSVWRETFAHVFPCPHALISIHSLRMEGDRQAFFAKKVYKKFQSTPSVWRETAGSIECIDAMADFNPLPPYGGRPNPVDDSIATSLFQSTPSVWRETHHHTCVTGCQCISIHSLRMEGDP